MIDPLLETQPKPSKIYEGIIQINSHIPNAKPIYLTYEIETVKKRIKNAQKTLATTENYKDALSVISSSPSGLKEKANEITNRYYIANGRFLRFVNSFESSPNKVDLTVFVYEFVPSTVSKVIEPSEIPL